MPLNAPENEGFRRELRDMMQRIVRLAHPAPPEENGDIVKSAWCDLLVYDRHTADTDASDLIEKGWVSDLGESNMTQSRPDALFNAARSGDSMYRQAWIRVVHDRAVLYTGNQVVASYASVGGIDRPDTRFLQRHHGSMRRERLAFVQRPPFDNTQIAILASWLMERPWHRLFLTLNFHCPDAHCGAECWLPGEHRKGDARRKKCCEQRRFDILNQVHDGRPLSQDNRYKLTERLRSGFEASCAWLRSPGCAMIPRALVGTLPGAEDHETHAELVDCPGLFYAGLYWFRSYRRNGQGAC